MQVQSQNSYNFYFDLKIYFVYFQSLNIRDERKNHQKIAKGVLMRCFIPLILHEKIN
jgi:hypothetical protein